MNLMKLGDFTDEIKFHDQEMIVDRILELCQFYNITVPNTFKQAMKSDKKEEWRKAIAVELNNLEEMRVWAIGQLPPGKKELNGRWVFATKPDVRVYSTRRVWWQKVLLRWLAWTSMPRLHPLPLLFHCDFY
jgi:hypothetical protein